MKSLLLLMAALVFCALCAPAQMPTDNDAWAARCNSLHDLLPLKSTPTPAFLRNSAAAVPGGQWTTFGWDRSRADQHAVACVFFYLGAMAERDATSTHATRTHHNESWTMGLIEWQAMHGTAPTTAQSLERDHAKLAEIPKSPLTVAGEQTMVETARTLPVGPSAAN